MENLEEILPMETLNFGCVQEGANFFVECPSIFGGQIISSFYTNAECQSLFILCKGMQNCL